MGVVSEFTIHEQAIARLSTVVLRRGKVTPPSPSLRRCTTSTSMGINFGLFGKLRVLYFSLTPGPTHRAKDCSERERVELL